MSSDHDPNPNPNPNPNPTPNPNPALTLTLLGGDPGNGKDAKGSEGIALPPPLVYHVVLLGFHPNVGLGLG